LDTLAKIDHAKAADPICSVSLYTKQYSLICFAKFCTYHYLRHGVQGKFWTYLLNLSCRVLNSRNLVNSITKVLCLIRTHLQKSAKQKQPIQFVQSFVHKTIKLDLFCLKFSSFHYLRHGVQGKFWTYSQNLSSSILNSWDFLNMLAKANYLIWTHGQK
jgi:hypothetical protein